MISPTDFIPFLDPVTVNVIGIVVLLGTVIGGSIMFFSSPRRSAETWHLRAPLPKSRQMVVYNALEVIKFASYTYVYPREAVVDEANKHLRSIVQDIERYYRVLNGRPDAALAFIKIEQFANLTVTNYVTLTSEIRYADRKALRICLQEIAWFATYAYNIAERAVTEKHSATYGAIQLRDEERQIDRELDALVAPKGLMVNVREWWKEASNAFVRKAS